MVGDSAGAGFHIPSEWLSYENLSLLPTAVQNEFDYPQQSWATGFEDYIQGESIYLKLRNRNRCNHRDYQNLSKNGAEMKHLAEHQADSIVISQHPMLVFTGYIGNDVCAKSLDLMTPVASFRASLLAGLARLDQRLPAGSKVVFLGLVDGRVLWDTMSDQIHPLGCTYAEFYTFLSCTDSNPCQTWLNVDSRVRDATTKRANELSAVIQNVAANNRYKNFEILYMPFPMDEAIARVKARGQNPAVLIEQIDGFHPSPTAHRVFSGIIWENLSRLRPSWVGPVNPFNDQIQSMFGNQEGH
jgi:acyloxyacyl hydrolase